MKLLLDECVDARLKRHLRDHETLTVPQAGWAGKRNGELLKLASGRFEIFITVDQNLPHQQNVASLPLAAIVLIPPLPNAKSLLGLAAQLLSTLGDARPGSVTILRGERGR